MPEVIDLDQELGLFSDHWQPRIVAALNVHHGKLAKLHGEFAWHRHSAEEELFLVLKGSLLIRLREKELHLAPGQLVVIPCGVEHIPVAVQEAHISLLEPADTINTGDAPGERTTQAEWI